MYFHESTNWGHYFYVTNLRRDHHFTWSSEPREGLAACSAKGVYSFLSYFKILSIGPAPGIEPATSRPAIKRSTNWAYPAVVLTFFLKVAVFCMYIYIFSESLVRDVKTNRWTNSLNHKASDMKIPVHSASLHN